MPERSGRTLPLDLSKPREPWSNNTRLEDGLFQLGVRARSPYIGAAPAAIDLTDYPGLTLVAIQAGDGSGRLRRPALAEGDILIVRGNAETAGGLASDNLLAFRAEDAPTDVAETLFDRALVWPRS